MQTFTFLNAGFPVENPLNPNSNIEVRFIGAQSHKAQLQTGESNKDFIIIYSP